MEVYGIFVFPFSGIVDVQPHITCRVMKRIRNIEVIYTHEPRCCQRMEITDAGYFLGEYNSNNAGADFRKLHIPGGSRQE